MSSTKETSKVAIERARPSRAEEEGARRRRRDPNDNGMTLRLAVPEEKLDRRRYAYRFVNDISDRVNRLYNQDWDLVPDAELTPDMPGERAADVVVGSPTAGLRTRLMRKPIEFFNEDQAAKQQRLDDEMNAAAEGRTVLNGPGGDGLSMAHAYKPKSSNQL